MSIGKSIRMSSIFRRSTGRTVIVALDHGGIMVEAMVGIVHEDWTVAKALRHAAV